MTVNRRFGGLDCGQTNPSDPADQSIESLVAALHCTGIFFTCLEIKKKQTSRDRAKSLQCIALILPDL